MGGDDRGCHLMSDFSEAISSLEILLIAGTRREW